jgi:hypothetical protein
MLRNSKTPPNFGQKEIFLLFNQSAYNKQWLGVEHLTWLVILVLTTTSTIKGVVWDNKFILAYGLSKIKGDSKTKDDRLELNSLWVKSKWRLVLFCFSILKVRWTPAMIKTW